MTSHAAALTLVFASLLAADASGDPPRTTAQTGGGVRVAGESRASSVGVAREPRFTLTNLTDAPRAVELISLTSYGLDGARRALTIRGRRSVTLAPRGSERLEVDYEGDALHAGGGLSHRRFALSIAVGDARLVAVASNFYVCRIPVRPPEAP